MEALSVFEDEKKRHRRRVEAIEQQYLEVRRNVVSPFSPSIAADLNRVQRQTEFLFDDFRDRLLEAIEILGSTAELIHPTPEILRASRADVLIEDPRDNLILASVLGHAKNHPSETKIFLSENRKDFDINTGAKLALRGGGLRYFADASTCLEWHRARPES
jgi:hypothetical protein